VAADAVYYGLRLPDRTSSRVGSCRAAELSKHQADQNFPDTENSRPICGPGLDEIDRPRAPAYTVRCHMLIALLRLLLDETPFSVRLI
jgi:hypothetical protein